MFDPIFSKILVAYDGSDPSRHALDIAAKTAAILRGDLTILTVVPVTPLPFFSEEGLSSFRVRDIQEYQRKMREHFRISLEKAEVDVREHYPNLNIEAVLLEGTPSSVILEESEKRNVDLIMMGSRGLGGFSGILLGSTSRKVVDQCTKAILIVK
jgi:nucleotide-binding universal stress UspA family protein